MRECPGNHQTALYKVPKLMPFDRFAHCCNGLGGGSQNHGYGLSPFTKVVSISLPRPRAVLLLKERLLNFTMDML